MMCAVNAVESWCSSLAFPPSLLLQLPGLMYTCTYSPHGFRLWNRSFCRDVVIKTSALEAFASWHVLMACPSTCQQSTLQVNKNCHDTAVGQWVAHLQEVC